MSKIMTMFVFLAIWSEAQITCVYCYTSATYLRKFGISTRAYLNALKLHQKIQDELEKQIEDRKSEHLLKMDMERRNIYKQHLLASQGGSSILKDFNTNRF
jgi:hypothetical protein